MNRLPFPIATWGTVLCSHGDGPKIQEVRIERSEGGGFLILTNEEGRVFDSWVESVSDVLEFIDGLSVEWGPLD